nr:transposase [Enterobacter quasiroggenkampii]
MVRSPKIAEGASIFIVCVKVGTQLTTVTSLVGIDLGLKDYATSSEGEKLITGKFYRNLEFSLDNAQWANKKARVRAIHAKIKNRRKDALHKLSTALVNRHAAIFVDDESSKKLVKT